VPFRIEWNQEALDDLEMLDSFDSPIIHREVRLLEHHADLAVTGARSLRPSGGVPRRPGSCECGDTESSTRSTQASFGL